VARSAGRRKKRTDRRTDADSTAEKRPRRDMTAPATAPATTTATAAAAQLLSDSESDSEYSVGRSAGRTGAIFFDTNESEMVGFDSRSGSQRVEAKTTTTATTATTASGGESKESVMQKLSEMAGVVTAEMTAGNIAVAIDKRNASKAQIRGRGLMIDTEAEVVGKKVALEEAMQNESEAFHFAARTDAVHIETGIISTV